MKKTKGAMEAEISKVITQWEKDYLGRGSISVKTDILRDMIIVSLKGVLTPAEYSVCETKDGLLSIKRTRADLVESGSLNLKQLITNITDHQVLNFYTDISTRTGERMMIFRLHNDLEQEFHL